MENKKRGRPVGWRKENPQGRIKQFVTTSISGTPEEIQKLKRKAAESNKSLSRFIFDNLID